jgi:hypothetical protein
MKKILMTGDSWGYGAGYSLGNNIVISPADIFTDCDFTNECKPGLKNSDTIGTIAAQLSNSYYDAIFWIQTDPMRDLWEVFAQNSLGAPGDWSKDCTLTEYGINICSTTNLVKYIENLLFESYKQLNIIAKTWNKKIYCLGGCSMLHPKIRKYSNLIPIIPSIIQFLVPTFKKDTFLYNTHWLTTIIQYHDNYVVNQTFKDNLREIIDLYHPKETEIFGLANYFKYTTDYYHPDPEGMRLWTTECKRYI